MPLCAGHLLRLLALGALAVPVYGLTFNFTDVQQCEPVVIFFSGADIQTPPSFLTIIPLNSTAITVPLQNTTHISTGISVSFLPLEAGSNFLASLDGSDDESLIPISDLIRVFPSPNGNSSCLPNPSGHSPQHFTIQDTVSQCEDFSVTYDTSAVSKAPSVRLFNPRGISFLLNNTSDDRTNGVATYTMSFPRGHEVVLSIGDGASMRETSPLLTVGGDSSSNNSCIMHKNASSSYTSNNTTSAMSVGHHTPFASKAVLIGSIAGGAAVLLIALAMVIFVIRDRRRRRKSPAIEFDPSAMEKARDNEKGNMGVTPRPLRSSATGTGAVSNPIYTTNSFLSVGPSSSIPRGSMASWAQVVPEDQRYPASIITRSSTVLSPSARLAELENSSRIVVIPPDSESPKRPDRPSLESLDIEGMLNMASVQSEGNGQGSRKNSDIVPFGPVLRTPSLTVPIRTNVRNPTSRRHLRDPSDVPAGPDSMLSFSGYSVNPFDNQSAAYQEPLRTGDSLRSPGGVGLPRSPRVFRTHDRASSSDWYGIAR